MEWNSASCSADLPQISRTHQHLIDRIRRNLGLHRTPAFCAAYAAALCGRAAADLDYKGGAIETVVTHLAGESERFCLALVRDLEGRPLRQRPQLPLPAVRPRWAQEPAATRPRFAALSETAA